MEYKYAHAVVARRELPCGGTRRTGKSYFVLKELGNTQ